LLRKPRSDLTHIWDRIIRHDLLAKEVHRSFRSAFFTAQLEQRNLMEGTYRPGDKFVENWFNGRAAAFDISVTHPAAFTYYKAAAKKDNDAATVRGNWQVQEI
jgi:hypothetical protein